jgi:hypothetical protein
VKRLYYWLSDLWYIWLPARNVRRSILSAIHPLSAIHRRRRCEACRSRMTSKTYGPYNKRRPPWESLYLDEGATGGRYLTGARYLCDECHRKNAEIRAVVEAKWEQELAGVVKRFTKWLRRAPQRTRISDHDFVEVMDLTTVAEQLARYLLYDFPSRWHPSYDDDGPLRLDVGARHPRRGPPSSYGRVVARVRPMGHERAGWKASIYRLNGDRIALHWRPPKDNRYYLD